MKEPPESFDTDRLVLRRTTLDDADWIFENYSANLDVTRYLTWPAHTNRSETQAFLRRCDVAWGEGSAFPWVIELKSGAPIGMVEIRVRPPRVDVGYVLAPSQWGHGFMTEVVVCLRDWALAQPGVERFWAVCDVENVASRRVLEKAGLELEGVLKRWEKRPSQGGEARDCFCFAAIASD